MSAYESIRTVFETTLKNTTGLPSRIFYENVNYAPVSGEAHLVSQLFHTSREPSNLGLSPLHRYLGFYRIIVYVPEGNGPRSAENYASTIISAFDSTRDITYDGTTVSIRYTNRAQGFNKSPWYYIPVDIFWYHYNEE